jgi:hypothetical protein
MGRSMLLPLLVVLLPVGTAAPAGAAIASGAGVPAPDTLVVLQGTVRSEGYRADGFLPGALVEVRQEGRTRTGVAGAGGEYRIPGLGPGLARLTVSHIGAFPVVLDVHLPDRGSAFLDLDLERRAIPLRPIQLRSIPRLNEPAEPVTEGGRRTAALRLRALEASPGMVESGLAAALSHGMVDGEIQDPSRALFMRGSTVTARTVLLDGAQVLTPFHVAGLVEPFDPDVMGEASLFMGGAPSRFQGGLSYLLDLDTRAPRRDRVRGSVGMDGLAARGVLEAPLPGGAGVLVSARGIHGLQERAGGADAFPYAHHDVLVRLSASPAPQHHLRVTGFRNREGVQLDLDPDHLPGRDRAEWGNQLVSGLYEGVLGSAVLRVSGASTRYESVLPVPWEDPLLARAFQDRERIAADLRLPVAGGSLELGGAIESLDLTYLLETGASVEVTELPDAREASLSSVTSAAHAEWEGEAAPSVRVRGGLRAETTSHDGRTRLVPRAGVRLLLGDRAVLRIDAGGSHQIVSEPGLRARLDPEGSDELDWAPSLHVASASHLVVALDQELTSDLRMELSAFARGFRGTRAGRGIGDGGDRSRSSGVELRMAREGERAGVWLGYALSWFWTVEGAGGSTRFDGWHVLSTGFRTEPVPGLELRGSLGYGAGAPLTAVAADRGLAVPDGTGPRFENLSGTSELALTSAGGVSPLEAAPSDDFLRLDLEVSWRVRPSVRGRSTELRPYLKALNALNRRDAMFFYFDRWRGEDVRPVTERPFLPVFGIEWRF